MNKYKDWKMIDWIILGFVGISFISIPDWMIEHNLYKFNTMVTVYDYPYNIPIIISGIFLIYCFLLGGYWVRNKKNNMVVHYCLLGSIYILFIYIFIIAHNSGF